MLSDDTATQACKRAAAESGGGGGQGVGGKAFLAPLEMTT